MAKKSWLKIVAFAVGVLGILWTGLGKAELGPQVPAGKKLLGFACDRMNTDELKRRVTALEQHIPFDGVIITVYPDEYRKPGVPFTLDGRYGLWFGGKKHSRNNFQAAVADLKATKFQRFTDNFMDFQTTVRSDPKPEEANVDWFDEEWSTVASNGAVAAYVAKEGELKGLLIDVEPYGGGAGVWRYPFDYKKYAQYMKEGGKTPRSMDECQAQVRKRGREFMQAVTAVYPEITIIVIPDTGWDSGPLVRSFVEGMLEVRGKATMVDGVEQAYYAMSYKEFSKIRKGAENAQTSELYRGMEYGFGVWWDWKNDPWGLQGPATVEKNNRKPNMVEHSLYNALIASDRYVWVYSSGAYRSSIWWTSSSSQRANGGVEIPKDYLDAFKNCRKPHDLEWTPSGKKVFVSFDGAVLVEGEKITEDKANLLKNGNLEIWSAGKDKAPDGWTLVLSAAGGEKFGRVHRDANLAKVGRYSAQLTTAKIGDTGHVSLDQLVPAKFLAGKTVTFGAWVKSNAFEIGNLEILGIGSSKDAHPGDGKWHFMTVTGKIPEDAAGNITFLLKALFRYTRE